MFDSTRFQRIFSMKHLFFACNRDLLAAKKRIWAYTMEEIGIRVADCASRLCVVPASGACGLLRRGLGGARRRSDDGMQRSNYGVLGLQNGKRRANECVVIPDGIVLRERNGQGRGEGEEVGLRRRTTKQPRAVVAHK
jgi:hypothetical protein